MEHKQHIYAPIKCVQKKVRDDFTVLKLSANVDKLVAWLQEHRNDRGFIDIDVVDRREIGEYGQTHNARLNTFNRDQHGQTHRPASRRIDDADVPTRMPGKPAPQTEDDGVPY